MRFLLTFLSFWTVQQVVAQACLLPESMNHLKPERCGIRYVKTVGDQIEVILEFDKRARVITPLDAGNAKGTPLTLRGIYHLTYDQSGYLLNEERKYVRTTKIPEKSMFFGVNEQRGKLLESDPVLISVADYDALPWAGVRIPAKKKEDERVVNQYYETALHVTKEKQISALEVTKYVKKHGKFEPELARIDLEMYDSSHKKAYWTMLQPPSSDDAEGYTLALLNRYDRQKSKEISRTHMRLSAFDTAGIDTLHRFDFNFEVPMKIVYRREDYRPSAFGPDELGEQILVFAPSQSNAAANYTQYEYYRFDKRANLLSHSSILLKEDVFSKNEHFMTDSGVIYLASNEHTLNSLYISDEGKYNASSTADRLTELKRLMVNRTNHLGVNLVVNTLHQDPTVFGDKSRLVVFRVEENVGVRGADLSTNAATMICHGLLVAHLAKDGRVIAAKYYQRPENADPRASVEVGPIERNDRGLISFYATERTSVGAYPVLYTINGANVSIKRNETEATASNFIYYDFENAIVGYFGLQTDPDDPRVSVKTVEIVK